MTTPHEQMIREALQNAEVEMRYAGWANYVHDNFGRQEAYRTVQQALASTHEPAHMVRLGFEEIEECFPDNDCNPCRDCTAIKTTAQALHNFANAIMDAMIARNGGK